MGKPPRECWEGWITYSNLIHTWKNPARSGNNWKITLRSEGNLKMCEFMKQPTYQGGKYASVTIAYSNLNPIWIWSASNLNYIWYWDLIQIWISNYPNLLIIRKREFSQLQKDIRNKEDSVARAFKLNQLQPIEIIVFLEEIPCRLPLASRP